MTKLTKDIFAIPLNKVYPETIKAGQDCPQGLEAYAESIGALEVTKNPALSNKAVKSAPENKGAAK